MSKIRLVAIRSVAVAALMASAAHAQTAPGVILSPLTQPSRDSNERFWSEGRRADAVSKQPELRLAPTDRKDGGASPSLSTFSKGGEIRAGRAPSVETNGVLGKRVLSGVPTSAAAPYATGVGTTATGAPAAADPLPFSTSRVFPNQAVSTYPYSAAGRLYFSDPVTKGNYLCSASVIAPRIVLTAGHCVAKPSTVASARYFYTNFNFVPAMNGTQAPFGTWTAARALVSSIWMNSSGSVPNAQDVALLIITDQQVSGANRRIGDVTGTLGTATGALSPNQVTMLGYPGSFDSGTRMAVTFAGSSQSVQPNTAIYGSSFTGGSSGGPWVQNFGTLALGQSIPFGTLNAVVGVTSFGPATGRPNYLGASNLMPTGVTGGFGDMLKSACALATGNC